MKRRRKSNLGKGAGNESEGLETKEAEEEERQSNKIRGSMREEQRDAEQQGKTNKWGDSTGNIKSCKASGKGKIKEKRKQRAMNVMCRWGRWMVFHQDARKSQPIKMNSLLSC